MGALGFIGKGAAFKLETGHFFISSSLVPLLLVEADFGGPPKCCPHCVLFPRLILIQPRIDTLLRLDPNPIANCPTCRVVGLSKGGSLDRVIGMQEPHDCKSAQPSQALQVRSIPATVSIGGKASLSSQHLFLPIRSRLVATWTKV